MKNKITLTKDNIKILICCHKPCELPPNPDGIFLPIQVGAAISDVDLGMQRDDQLNGKTCDNISAKNKCYCELTALYWAWKNIKKIYPDLEYIGLNHYRRYFSFKIKNHFDPAVIMPENEIINYKFDKTNLEKILEKRNIIVAKRRIYPYPVEINYAAELVSDDMRTLKNIIHKKYPQYIPAVSNIITNGNKLSLCNMFIMKWSDFESYCTWLFSILTEAEKEINITNYSTTQKRIFGYMAERLLNVWIHSLPNNKKNIKEANIAKYTDVEKNSKQFYIKNYIKNSIAFNIAFKPLGIGKLIKTKIFTTGGGTKLK